MIRSAALFAGAFLVAASAGWLVLPATLYRSAAQPFQFNHKAHTGPKGGMACNDCHALRENGSFAGIPKLESCAGCHSEAQGNTKAEKEFVANFVKPNREPQWHVYSRQPENAFFPHAAHLKRAGLKCESCHGDHGKSETLPLYQVNRITGYSLIVMGSSARTRTIRTPGLRAGMRMDDCVSCHRRHRLDHACLDCHK